MGAADAVLEHFTMIYVAVIFCIKVCGVVYGISFSSGFMVIVATTMMFLILVTTLTWDLLRKFKYVYAMDHSHPQEICKGGICWHGVAEKSPASQLRFNVPHHLPSYGTS